eukprot:TRINITY_DN14372_c3_g1_i1.p1 TRINITY_DN14372_c3_g1~~TRINITY_DN14372_c3_g1_i1.p1  ORF type:complete len:458 (-),score=93.34 TRINITY_DN14372_c3_g1_i1:191-1564(-)
MSNLRSMPVRRDDTRRMEEEARKMECKIEALRRVMDTTDGSTAETGKWKGGSAHKPIKRGYVKDVVEAPTRTKKSTGGQRRFASETKKVGAKIDANNCAVGDLLSTGGSSPSASPTTRAAANLQAAVQQQSSASSDVELFLAELKLDRYFRLFVEHGFDCIEVVQEMEEIHMREIGMATGHILKLKKHLAELNGTAATTCSSQASSFSAGGAGVDAATTRRHASFGSAKTLDAKPTATSRGATSPGLLDGVFDEGESAASFQEALRAWRSGSHSGTSGSPGSPRAMEPNSVSGSAGETTQELNSYCFWSSVGDGEIDLKRATTPLHELPPELRQTGTQSTTEKPESQGNGTPREEKLCCYQCYKQFYTGHAVKQRSPLPDGVVRQLCSEECAERWTAAMKMKAEALRKRQEQIERMKDKQRAFDKKRLFGSPTDAGCPSAFASQAIQMPVPAMAAVA